MSLRLFLALFGVLVMDFVWGFLSLCLLFLASLQLDYVSLLSLFCLSNCFLWLSDVFVSLWGFVFCHFVGALCILWLFSVSWCGFNYVYAVMFVSLW